jgi:HEAT repeat protein
MFANRNGWNVQRVLGQAMIAAGICCVAAEPAATQGAAADAPRVENTNLETHAVGGSLDATFRELAAKAEKPEWIGYAVEQVPGDRGVCCNNNWNDGDCGTCRLENERNSITTNHGEGSVHLEGARQLVVLFRLEGKQVGKIRVASMDCTLDAGGLPFVWLTGVKPAESIALLAGYVRGPQFDEHGDHVGNGALTAIAMHGDPAADLTMENLVAPDQPEKLRKQASFWMGAARGKAGFIALQKMAKSDPSTEVRGHVAFALSVSHEAGAVDEMIRMAHDDTSSHVRGQALFWLAQKAGNKAVGAITGAIENDPDTEVKKKAVFALSQLPKDEGVPKLIEVAQTNHNPAVRKQAMFWLGQSNDPRALQFFEKVLTQ